MSMTAVTALPRICDSWHPCTFQVLRVVRTTGDQPAPAEVPAALMDGGASQQQNSSLDPASLSAHLAVEELQVPKPRVAGCERPQLRLGDLQS